MDKDLKLTQATDEDVLYLVQEFGQSSNPVHLRQLTEKLAFQKTASQRNQDVALYDPAAVYEVGAAVYKEYDESLTVSSKSVEHFKGTVVLTVVHKSRYELYDCEMLEVDFAGGGTFRKEFQTDLATADATLAAQNAFVDVLASDSTRPQISRFFPGNTVYGVFQQQERLTMPLRSAPKKACGSSRRCSDSISTSRRRAMAAPSGT
jgi:hypothetical protein